MSDRQADRHDQNYYAVLRGTNINCYVTVETESILEQSTLKQT